MGQMFKGETQKDGRQICEGNENVREVSGNINIHVC